MNIGGNIGNTARIPLSPWNRDRPEKEEAIAQKFPLGLSIYLDDFWRLCIDEVKFLEAGKEWWFW
jgi:hypothetical protein